MFGKIPGMERVGFLDPFIIAKAEKCSKLGEQKKAYTLAGKALGLDTSVTLNRYRVAFVARDLEETKRLAYAGQLRITAGTTIANYSMWPSSVFSYLRDAMNVYGAVFNSPQVRKTLSGVQTDHTGHSYDFRSESRRGLANLLEASAPLFSTRGDVLLKKSGEILQAEYDRLPDYDPLKYLIGIRQQLLNFKRGNVVDEDGIIGSLRVMSTIDKDCHRVATTAAWVASYGERLGNDQMFRAGVDTINALFLTTSNRELWQEMLNNERGRLKMLPVRNSLVSRLGTVMINPKARNDLFYDLKYAE